ncbi:flavin reductase family protein [Streptomyces sp. ISL-100]|uniref:flavin reductase family protein n=1 Tax=Streptomyces sp. ISL-100 TaxID=2819173 RepID=UPI001BE610F0|nr:flavin reductase family protein [Streptomyces sp. ISL-100]MBT2399844.1 flavin reductase family protein [Streptomyces sp. ISL-100]
MSSFPTGVTVVTSTGRDDSPRGVTCSSLSSVAAAPPTLLVCLKTRGSTLDAIRAREWFAVNLLHARARTTAEVFSSPVADRFAHVPWRPAGTAGLPWLHEDAFAVAECSVTGLYAAGDHTVVLGEVAGVELRPGVPLLYGMREFSAWPVGQAAGTGPTRAPARNGPSPRRDPTGVRAAPH